MNVSASTNKVARPREGEEGYQEYADRDGQPKRDYGDRDGQPKRDYGDRDGQPKRDYGDKEAQPRREFTNSNIQRSNPSFAEKPKQQTLEFAEDFETVTDKKRVVKPYNPSGEMSFGNKEMSFGKPMFSRQSKE
jgi:hypothetical protein